MMCKGEPPVSPSCLSGTSVNKTESSVLLASYKQGSGKLISDLRFPIQIRWIPKPIVHQTPKYSLRVEATGVIFPLPPVKYP